MKSIGYSKWVFGAFLSVLLSVLMIGASQTWSQSNQLSDIETATGWRLLFDGKDPKNGWVNGDAGVANAWFLEDDAMKNNGFSENKGNLYTKDTFKNFEFSFDIRVSKGGNSGVFIRVTNRGNWLCGGYEFAILDHENHEDGTQVSRNPQDKFPDGKPWFIKRTGAVYDIYATTVDGKNQEYYPIPLSPLEYNHGVIFADGNHIEHWLNGRKVVDMEIGSADWTERFKRSKFGNGELGCADSYSKAVEGQIGFQDHGNPAIRNWIRNVKIRTFESGSVLPKPIIKAEASIAGKRKVSVNAGVIGADIRYTLDGSDPTATSMAYVAPFDLEGGQTLKVKSMRTRFLPSETAILASTTAIYKGLARKRNGNLHMMKPSRSKTNSLQLDGKIIRPTKSR